MSGFGRAARVLSLGAILAAAASTLGAQEVRLAALWANPDLDLLGGLRGGAAAVGIRVHPRLAVRLGMERLSGDQLRIGVPCAGLAQPGTCGPEQVRDESSLNTFGIGLDATAVRSPYLDVHLVPMLGSASVESTTRGLASGREIAATRTLVSLDLGAELAIRPRPWFPLALHLAARFGTLFPRTKETIADGYTPFEDGVSIARYEAGVTWSYGPRPRSARR